MKAKIHSFLIYPLLLLFSYLLKGRKENYDNFICDNINDFKNSEILEVNKAKNIDNYFDEIKSFFDKKSPLYDKTLVNLYVNLEDNPEDKKVGMFDISKRIDMYYSVSMLSSRVTNDNIFVNLVINEKKLNEKSLNHFLRVCALICGTRKVDKLLIKNKLDEKSKEALNYFKENINSSKIINFSKSSDLYVLTCEKKKEKFDIVWSSSNREIELTEFNKVFDKFGNPIQKDIKISNSIIYAFHK